jgi:hypothetical protein
VLILIFFYIAVELGAVPDFQLALRTEIHLVIYYYCHSQTLLSTLTQANSHEPII